MSTIGSQLPAGVVARLREAVSLEEAFLGEAYSAEQRRAMADRGEAMADGSFPIGTLEDLKKAIALRNNGNGDRSAIYAHIRKRATALGGESLLPEELRESEGGVVPVGVAERQGNLAGPAQRHGPYQGVADPARNMTQIMTDRDGASGSSVRLREVDLAEAQAREDGSGKHIVEVTLIRTGRSRNGYTYPHSTLREAAPLFEGSRAFVDHPKDGDLPERSVRDLVGYYRNVRMQEDGRLRAQLHLIPGNDWLFHLLKESQEYPDLCGVSIDAGGELEGEKGNPTVRRIGRVDSVDIVTRPAAGGSFDRILQSDRGGSHGGERVMGRDGQDGQNGQTGTEPNGGGVATPGVAAVATPGVAVAAAPTPAPAVQLGESQRGSGSPDLAKLVEQLSSDRERMQRELERVTAILSPGGNGQPDPKAELSQLAESIRREKEEMARQRDLARAEGTLESTLREAALPEPVTAKLRKAFAGRIFEPATLTESIAEEKATLAALTQQGMISGHGFEKPVTMGMSEYDQLQAAFDGLFDIYESEAAKSVPRFTGIREAFRVATGLDIGQTSGVDRPLLESFQAGLRAKARSGNLRESEVILREADVTTSSFSYLLGTSMNKRLLAEYQAWPSEWQKFSTIVAIKDFKQQDRVRLGAFGSLSTVAEDAAYTTLTVADTRAIYTATKRGNLVQITRETIINDDLYAIKQIPQKLAVAAAFTLAEFVYNLLAPNFGNIYDAHPLFDSINHNNTGVVAANLNTANSGAALSSAALQAAVVKMRKQTNLASKPIGLKPRYLLVPPDLEFTAMTILKSAGLPGGNNNDINPMMGYAEPIVAPQLNSLAAGPASTSIWIAVADPRIIDTVEVGFVGGQANPVLLIQDMPLYGLNFTQDTISYKVRHEYGGAVVDYRGFYLGNN